MAHPQAREDIPEEQPGLSARRYLLHVFVVTTLVAVLPVVAGWALHATGTITSRWVSSALAIGLSLAVSFLAGSYWRRRPDAGDVLFSDLLVWGWVRRWRLERQLVQASALLNLEQSDRGAADELSVERRHQLVKQLAEAFDARDVYLYGHSQRVARHAAMIARQMGLSSDEVAQIRIAAAIHDVGKIHTPKGILNKPGRLTDLEFDVIKRHPVDGAEIVAALNDRELTAIVRHHHERMDGTGYPDGLRGDQIPLGARIIAVADTFDAITSPRPYRTAKPHSHAIEIMRKEAGTQLDPAAVHAFDSYYRGNRPVFLWTTLIAALQRAFGSLSGEPAAAATVCAGKISAVIATVTIGATAATIPVLAPVATPTAGGASHLATLHRDVATRGTLVGVSELTSGTTAALLTQLRRQIGHGTTNAGQATHHGKLPGMGPVRHLRKARPDHAAVAKSPGSSGAPGSGTARNSGASAGTTHAGSGKPPGSPGRALVGGGKPPGTPGNGPPAGAGKPPSTPVRPPVGTGTQPNTAVGPQVGASTPPSTPVGPPADAGKLPSIPGSGPPRQHGCGACRGSAARNGQRRGSRTLGQSGARKD